MSLTGTGFGWSLDDLGTHSPEDCEDWAGQGKQENVLVEGTHKRHERDAPTGARDDAGEPVNVVFQLPYPNEVFSL